MRYVVLTTSRKYLLRLTSKEVVISGASARLFLNRKTTAAARTAQRNLPAQHLLPGDLENRRTHTYFMFACMHTVLVITCLCTLRTLHQDRHRLQLHDRALLLSPRLKFAIKRRKGHQEEGIAVAGANFGGIGREQTFSAQWHVNLRTGHVDPSASRSSTHLCSQSTVVRARLK